MIEVTREVTAYALIGAVLLAMLFLGLVAWRRRRRRKLRRRGVKTYGH